MARKLRLVTRNWFYDLEKDVARIRYRYERQGHDIHRFAVQLELLLHEEWQPVVRYDNAHGFCHRDALQKDGGWEKVRVYWGSNNDTFTRADRELRENWEDFYRIFEREEADDEDD